MTHCDGMTETGEGTWAYAFSKGQQTGSVVIGIKDGAIWGAGDWWNLRMNWIPTFFKLAFGPKGPLIDPDRVVTFRAAFDETCFRVWGKKPEDTHMEFYGDESMTFLDLW